MVLGLMKHPNWADHFPITIGDTYRHGGVSQEPL